MQSREKEDREMEDQINVDPDGELSNDDTNKLRGKTEGSRNRYKSVSECQEEEDGEFPKIKMPKEVKQPRHIRSNVKT